MLTQDEITRLEAIEHHSDTRKYSVNPQGQYCEVAQALRTMGVDARPPGRAFDIGAGFGYYVRVLQDWGWDAIALNPPTNGVYKQATAILGVTHIEHTITEDCALPPDIGTADLILLFHVNVFLRHPERLRQIGLLARRLFSHLRPGGWLVVEPNRGELSIAWTREVEWSKVLPSAGISVIDDVQVRLTREVA